MAKTTRSRIGEDRIKVWIQCGGSLKQEFENEEDFASQSFEAPTLSYEQEMVFKGEKPAVIWSYDKLSRIERSGEPNDTNDTNLLTLQEGKSAKKDFIQLYGGLHSGVAWRWK